MVSVELETERQEDTEDRIRVIFPGSKGLAVLKDYQPYLVKSIFFSPKEGTVGYRGKYENSADEVTSIIFPINTIVPIEESAWSLYDLETGEIKQIV